VSSTTSDDRQQLVDATKRSAESSRAALAELQQQLEARLEDTTEAAAREATEQRAALQAAKRAAEEAANRHREELDAAAQAHTKALADVEAKHQRALAMANGEQLKAKAIADAEHAKALAAREASIEVSKRELEAEHARAIRELTTERDELVHGLSSTREQLRRSEAELGAAVQTIADHNVTARQYQTAIDERDQRIAELRKELESLEQENTSYQDQVLRAYQKIKSDEAMVARARKAMAIALTVLDDEGNPSSSSS
jgi:chromosome segregation ATPase